MYKDYHDQGLEILEINGPWARLVAWDHRDGHRAEGYFLVKRLTALIILPCEMCSSTM